MKNIHRSIAGLMVLILLVPLNSCKESWFDINHNPNNPEAADINLVLPASISSAAALINVNWNICGSMWSQHWTQSNTANQYTNFDSYNLDELDFRAEWRESYAGVLNDLRYIKTQAELDEDWNMYFISEVLSVYVWQYLADMYGEIPYSEALKGETEGILEPVYDTGEEIYSDLIARLDDAMTKDFDAITNTNPEDQDFIFGGDIDLWTAFANTLKLKIYVRQWDARESVASTGASSMFNDNVSFLTTHAQMTAFADDASQHNPLYESDQVQLNTDQNIRASATMVTYLAGKGDSRIAVLFSGRDSDGAIVGLEQGGHAYSTTEQPIGSTSQPIFNPIEPVYFISVAESYFFQAEANLRLGNTGDDKIAYDNALTAAFAKYDLDASTYIADDGVYEYPSDGTFDEKMEAIMMQKWVALCNQSGLEAYIEIKRTGYPKQSSVAYTDDSYETDHLGELTRPLESVLSGFAYPARFLYPNWYIDRNSNAHTQEAITARVWWDVN